MSRTMTSRITEAAVVAAALVLAGGCSKKYGHERLGTGSPEAAKVHKMLLDLREAGEKGLDETIRKDGADGLSQAQAKMLRATLLEMIRADAVELERMDRFGGSVWRAIFELTTREGSSTAAVLIVIPEDGRPRWAGRN